MPTNNVVFFTDVCVTLITYRYDVKRGNRAFGYSETSLMSDEIQNIRKVM